MSAGQHTPGPWFVDRRRDGDINAIDILAQSGDDVVTVATVSNDKQIRGVERADAALIAAAPQLRKELDLLVEIVGGGLNCACTIKQRDSGHHVDCSVPQIIDRLAEARAALAKARGAS